MVNSCPKILFNQKLRNNDDNPKTAWIYAAVFAYI